MDLVSVPHYHVEKKLGKGTFGEVYRGRHRMTGDHVALKFEHGSCQVPQLHVESVIYDRLAGTPGIPSMVELVYLPCGSRVLIMELLGPSLQTLLGYCHMEMSLKTVLQIADQMILRMQALHNIGYVHRDVKAENFVVGIGSNSGSVYLIDYGLANCIINSQTKSHIPYKEKNSRRLTGTAWFASINSHFGIEQSRRDDLESLGYTLIYLATGCLPWYGVKGDKSQERILHRKMMYSIDRLCKGLPLEFHEYMSYCRGLKFHEDPDYDYLRSLFRNAFVRAGYVDDQVYDWMLLSDQNDDES